MSDKLDEAFAFVVNNYRGKDSLPEIERAYAAMTATAINNGDVVRIVRGQIESDVLVSHMPICYENEATIVGVVQLNKVVFHPFADARLKAIVDSVKDAKYLRLKGGKFYVEI